MDRDFLRSFERYLSERADRPFGDVEAISGRTLQPFSIAAQQAAKNLLDKAHRALGCGDVDRAKQFVDRAVRLPFDEHEGAAPAAIAAHMNLFSVVTDALEQSKADDSEWLDAALDVLAVADEPARFDMRDVLVAIDHDYTLTSMESSRIRAAVATVAERAELRDLKLTSSELGEHILSILCACRHYAAVFEGTADRHQEADRP